MPNITDITLQIQKFGSPAPLSSRKVTVNYKVIFTPAEINARANFRITVNLVSDDISGNLNIVSFNTVASNTPLVRTETVNFERKKLDEDPDVDTWLDPLGHPHTWKIELKDSWKARVFAKYEPEPVFSNSIGFSPLVIGSWGALGNN